MGKGNWFSSVKKVLGPDFKQKKDPGLEKKWFGKQRDQDTVSSLAVAVEELLPPPPPRAPARMEELDLINGQAEEMVDVPPVAVNIQPITESFVLNTTMAVQPIGAVQLGGRSRADAAAITIQKTFRGYQARKASLTLRGLVRLNSLIEGPTVKRQVTSTLRCMQALACMQSRIHSRRNRMSEDNQALQLQPLQKCARELENLRIDEEWDDSIQSKEQIEEKLVKKFDAAMRRERALAYSFTHQQTWKSTPRPMNQTFLDPNNSTWGWSWLERWMAARPWEARLGSTKESSNNNSSVRSLNHDIAGEISTSCGQFQLNMDKNSPFAPQKSLPVVNGFQSPSTPSRPCPVTLSRKIKSSSPKVGDRNAMEDKVKSMVRVQSDFNRRRSIVGALLIQGDESLGGSPSIPSYMVATESARARSRLESPLSSMENNDTPEKGGSTGAAKKRLSYHHPPSPGRVVVRRRSGPPNANNTSIIESANDDTNGVVISWKR